MKYILGSASPRRRELLAMLQIPFDCVSIDADESYPDNLSGEEIPVYISRQKATAFGPIPSDTTLITADTIVWLNGKVYGKPHDANDAKRILHELSGKTHQVITGVTIVRRQGNEEPKSQSFNAITEVHFAPITDEQINYYVDTFSPLDKAGAYGIQEWIGAVGISGITGSYYNVMGLPVHQLYKHLFPHI